MDIKQQFLKSLNERQRRQYLGQLSLDLGHGGIKLVCETFSINPVSIRIGIKELRSKDELPLGRVRKAGGGRKKKIESDPDLPKVFAEVVEDYTAGNQVTHKRLRKNG